jgi:hypothetical protein
MKGVKITGNDNYHYALKTWSIDDDNVGRTYRIYYETSDVLCGEGTRCSICKEMDDVWQRNLCELHEFIDSDDGCQIDTTSDIGKEILNDAKHQMMINRPVCSSCYDKAVEPMPLDDDEDW